MYSWRPQAISDCNEVAQDLDDRRDVPVGLTEAFVRTQVLSVVNELANVSRDGKFNVEG
jgi:hypothetical protein